MRVIVGLGLCLICGVALMLLSLLVDTPPVQPNPGEQPVANTPDKKPAQPQANTELRDLFIGHNYSGIPKQIHTVLSTRKGDARYQAVVRYMPQSAPSTEMHGYEDIAKALMQRGKTLPTTVAVLDQETETLIDSLGEPMRSIVSYRAYVNPVDGHVLAYDLAQTNGGQPQRFVGHLTKTGINVEVYRGSEMVDRNEVPFSTRETFIPVEMEFVHQWFNANPESLKKREMVNFHVFIPEAMNFVLLVARPLDDQTIPVGDATYECARYEVLAISTLTQGGLQARQEMWFDKKSGMLMKRQDFEPSLNPADAPVTERTALEALRNMSHLIVRPDPLPEKKFPYELDEELIYTIKARSEQNDNELGRVRIKFSSANKRDPDAEFAAETDLTLLAKGTLRKEKALTLYDKQWRPVKYEASGEEGAEMRAQYQLEAEFKAGKLRFNVKRDSLTGAAAPAIIAVKSVLGEDNASPDALINSTAEAAESPAAPAGRKSIDQTLTRNLSTGTLLYDFNRIEHLIAGAFRLPLPKVPANDKEKVEPTYQRLALFSLRQNLAGVLPFEIRPEVKPTLTERQKRRLTREDREEPQLYVATTTAAILPCRMLLLPDGRILELTLKYGTMDLIFRLDHPIMRRRAERSMRERLMEGPRLLRPDWW